MADAAVKIANPAEAERELTDGFHLVIDALKLNGLTTIYGVPGIPITDFGRMAQAAGIRVLSFRHEQNAGYAASIAGFLTKTPGVCLTVSAPGFLNGLTALAHATTNCFPMILISGLFGARDRRPAAGRLRGDGPARHRQAALQGRVPRAACPGHRHRACARDPRRRFRPSRRRLSRPAGKIVRPGDGCGSRQEIAGEGDRRGAGADSRAKRRQARARRAQEREAPADHPRQGRRLCAGRRCDPQSCRKKRRAIPADEHGQGPSARYASAMRGRGTLDGAERQRRRDADRRAPQLAVVARQGQDLGRRAKEIHPDRHRAEGNGLECRDRSPGGRRHRLVRVGAAAGHGRQTGRRRRRIGSPPSARNAKRTSPRWRRG